MAHSSRTFLDELNEAAVDLRHPGKRKAEQVTADVLREFTPVASQNGHPKTQTRQLKTARRYCDRFCERMQDEPFSSEDEAINGLAPVAVWFFGWAARQFAILVIKALWRRWHQT